MQEEHFCAVLRLDGAVIHTLSRKQTLIATSTAEAEMYGILSVIFEGFSIRSLLRELGSSVELTTMTDSDAGRAVCSGKGFGKLKHVNIRFLWIQDAVAKKKVALKREPSISNVADLGTKHFTKERFEALRKMVDMEAISDRNSVRYIGTITYDKNEALELAQADISLMGVSTSAMVFWIEMDVQTTMQTKTEIGSDRHLAM